MAEGEESVAAYVPVEVDYRRTRSGGEAQGVFLKGGRLRVLHGADEERWKQRLRFAAAVANTQTDPERPVFLVLMGAYGLLGELEVARQVLWRRGRSAALCVVCIDPLFRPDVPGAREDMEEFARLLKPLEPAPMAGSCWVTFYRDVHSWLDAPATRDWLQAHPTTGIDVVQMYPPYNVASKIPRKDRLASAVRWASRFLAGLVVELHHANSIYWMFRSLAQELALAGTALAEGQSASTPILPGVGVYAPALSVHRDGTVELRWTGFHEFCRVMNLPKDFAASFVAAVKDAVATAKAALLQAPDLDRVSRRLTLLHHVGTTVVPAFPLLMAVPVLDYATDLSDLLRDAAARADSVRVHTLYQDGDSVLAEQFVFPGETRTAN